MKSYRLRLTGSLMVSVLLSPLLFAREGAADGARDPCGGLNMAALLRPAPATAKLVDEDWFIWGATMVRSKADGKFHVFYSRWPRALGHSAWVTHSEIAHGVGTSPLGPFEFRDVALPARGAEQWDGLCTHNPTVHEFDGKYYLYYMGNTGDGKAQRGLNWIHRNNQRIGVAVADHPDGPWTRFDSPLIDVSSDPDAPDALMVSNPSVAVMPDGRYLMVYKAVAKQLPGVFGGPVVHLTAIADRPTGPFIKQLKPVFTAEGHMFPAEDPYVWTQDGCFYAIVKDMKGAFTPAGRSLVLFYSTDGMDWKLAKHPLVSGLEIKWADGTIQPVLHLERPQLYIENGSPRALLLAADTEEARGHSFNVQIPLGGVDRPTHSGEAGARP